MTVAATRELKLYGYVVPFAINAGWWRERPQDAEVSLARRPAT